MLEIGRTNRVSSPQSNSPARYSPRPMLNAFQVDALTKHAGRIFVVTLLFTLIGIALALWRPGTFTATAQLILDNRELQVSQQDTMVASVALDDSMVLSQIEILRSEHIAMRVAETLDLAQHPAFQPTRSWLSPIRDLFASDDTRLSDPSSVNRAIAHQLQNNLEVARVGGSYLVEVAYTSQDPELSAPITNAVVQIYLEEQAEFNRLAAQSATAWLRERMQALGPSARIISEAAPASAPNGPGLITIAGAALVLGLIAGLGLALLAELLDDRIRTPEDLTRLTDAEFLGALPWVRDARSRLPFRRWLGNRDSSQDAASQKVINPWTLAQKNPNFMVMLRRASVAAMPPSAGEGPAILGVTSVLEGDGKTTAAANLARVMAKTGRRILLIDCNSVHPSLSKLLAPSAKAGLAEALSGEIHWSKVILRDSASQLHFLPIPTDSAAARVGEGIWLGPMQQLLEELGPIYDQIILEMPALMPSPDVRAAAHAVDSFLLVVSFGTTPVRQALSALHASGHAESKILGVMLNKVRRTTLQRLIDRLFRRNAWRVAYAS